MKNGSFLQGIGNKNDGNATTTKLVKHEKILQSQAQTIEICFLMESSKCLKI